MSVAPNLASGRRKARKLTRNGAFRGLVRAGFISRAVTYGVIGGLAIALALGAGTDGTAPNQQGALTLIASSTVGRIALVVVSAGLLSYAIWKLVQGVFGRGPEGGGGTGVKDRAGNAGGGLVYLGFFVVAIRVLAGSAGNSSAEPRQATGGILAWPGGPVIVGIGGAVLIAISLYQLYDGLSGGFAKDNKTGQMDAAERRLFLLLGRIGLSARAAVFTLIGYFLVRTAIDYDPHEAAGVDGALARLHHEGHVLVALVGAGLLTFAAFSLFEARYRRL